MRTVGAIIFLCLILTLSFLTTTKETNAASGIDLQEIITLTNNERADRDLHRLSTSSTLFIAAQKRADDMANREYFSHETPDGDPFWKTLEDVAYEYQYAGENLAVHFYTPEQLVSAWMRSPGHKANILNPNFEEIGVGIASGMRNGYKGYYVVQLFGTLLPNRDL